MKAQDIKIYIRQREQCLFKVQLLLAKVFFVVVIFYLMKHITSRNTACKKLCCFFSATTDRQKNLENTVLHKVTNINLFITGLNWWTICIYQGSLDHVKVGPTPVFELHNLWRQKHMFLHILKLRIENKKKI